MGEFRMPSLGADMEAGTLIEWVKHPGDAVTRGDIIAVVETQKGAIEIEVFEDGVLEQTVAPIGQQVPVGTVLALIRGPGPATGAVTPAMTPAAAQAAAVAAAVPPAAVAPAAIAPAPVVPADLVRDTVAPAAVAAAPSGAVERVEPVRVRVSPVARRLAADLGVDLSHVTGTGPQGAITRDDVERAVAAGAAAAKAPPVRPAAAVGPPRGKEMRAAIAAAMARSKREIPHYYLSTTIDMSTALAWLRAENERRPMTERLLPAVLLLKAVALAAREVPEVNGYWVDAGFRPGAGIHVGCAISLRGGGLVAPALHDVDKADLTTLMRKFQDLVARARAGSLRSSELTDSTITVTNLGDQGVEATFGIIYPPQVAIVGFGRIAERPWIGSAGIEARPLVTATLSGDHRASDGHRGGVFLAAIDRFLQRPGAL